MEENKIKSLNNADLAEHFGVNIKEFDEIVPKAKQRPFFDALSHAFTNKKDKASQSLRNIFPTLRKLMEKNINILIVGGSGSGKSETITALLKDARINNQEAKSKAGWSSETMDISAYQIDKCTVYDSPGLGDSDLLLKRQNPIAFCLLAWCPGGLTVAKALSISLFTIASTDTIPAPTAFNATSYDSLEVEVLSSIIRPFSQHSFM